MEDTEKSAAHGRYNNLYFRKEIGGFPYYISFHFGYENLQVGYKYPSDQRPEEYFKQEAAGLHEIYKLKSEKALTEQLKLAMKVILEKGIAHRTFLNVYLRYRQERKYLIVILNERMEKGFLTYKFRDFRELELEAYFLDFRNEAEFVARLESTYRYIEMALDYLV